MAVEVTLCDDDDSLTSRLDDDKAEELRECVQCDPNRGADELRKHAQYDSDCQTVTIEFPLCRSDEVKLSDSDDSAKELTEPLQCGPDDTVEIPGEPVQYDTDVNRGRDLKGHDQYFSDSECTFIVYNV